MNKKIVAYGSMLLLIVAGSVLGYIYKDNLIYPKEGDDQVLMFDNSKPGKWVLKNTDSSLDGTTKLKEFSKELCVTKEMIDSLKIKPIKDKLSLSSLDCSTIGTRESKYKASFNTSCTGMSKEEAIGVSIEGEITSFEDKGGIVLTYTMGTQDEPFKFKRETLAVRVGECN